MALSEINGRRELRQPISQNFLAKTNGADFRHEARIVLSFDVEEHFRIEAAAGLTIAPDLKTHYRERLEDCVRWLLDQLDRFSIKATFFVVGEITRKHAAMVRLVAKSGHEIGSHSWDHRPVHHFTPAAFREDVSKCKDALEQIIGMPVVGYRAPTFSIMKPTAWALDVLAEEGFAYDSSIYPIWHDRYGVPAAPRGPFRAKGHEREILELPPATWRAFRANIPVGGGGYFRLLPLFFMERAIDQIRQSATHPVAVLYFHPWEFDPVQHRLPLGTLTAFRTYVGIGRTRGRLLRLLAGGGFARAADVVKQLDIGWDSLPKFSLNGG